MGSAGSGCAGRIALYLLLSLNALVLATGLGMQYFEANRLPYVHDFNAEKIKLWSQPENYKPAATPAPPLMSDETTAPPRVAGGGPQASPAKPPVSAAAGQPAAEAEQPAQTPQTRLCVEIGEVSQAHYQEMSSLLKTSGLANGSCSYVFGKRLAWWVFWPPEYEAAQRDKVLQELHAAGVKDILPIGQGVMAQSFSVGAFASESQARLYRDTLRGKGLDKIDYGPRPLMGSGRLDCSQARPEQIAHLKAALPDWAKAVDFGACSAP